jgi:membrane protein
MDQARDGMMAPLDMPLDTLFQRRDSSGDEEKNRESNDGDH